MSRWRSLAFPLALGLILGGLTAWLERVSDIVIEEVKLPPNEPQYIATVLSAKRFDDSGSLKEQLDAPKGWQLPDQKNIFFEKPYLQVYEKGIPQYSVISDSANYEVASKKIFLQNNVMLSKAAVDERPAAQVFTDVLQVDTQTKIAHTDAPVQYQYGQSYGSSIGMTYDEKQGLLSLPAQVRAMIYETEQH